MTDKNPPQPDITRTIDDIVFRCFAQGQYWGTSTENDGLLDEDYKPENPIDRTEAVHKLVTLVNEARIDGGIKAIDHAEKLRHAVRVDHWNNICNNCHESLTSKPKSCPRCKYRFDFFTTMYPDEEKLAQDVRPDLPYLPYYDYGLTAFDLKELTQ
jgi:hypothetical protein